MKKLALFDFDKTIINVDSVVEFKNFLIAKGYNISNIDVSPFNFKLTGEVYNLLNKQNWLQVFQGKHFFLLNELISDYVEAVLIKKSIPEILKKIIDFQQMHIDVIILSASYRLIIEKYFEKIGITNLSIICTELEFENDIFTGNFLGLNCSGINKLIKLKNEIPLESYNLEQSYAFTDHISDLSFLTLVKNRYVVHISNCKDDWSCFFDVEYIKV